MKTGSFTENEIGDRNGFFSEEADDSENGHFFESYDNELLEVLGKHSTEEKNKSLPLGSGLPKNIKNSNDFFRIGDILHIKNEYRLKHNIRVNNDPELTFEDYCQLTFSTFLTYKNSLPRLDGNRIFYSQKHQNEVFNKKFD